MRTSCLLLAFFLANAIPAQGDHLYTVSAGDGMLRRVNPLTGITSFAVQMVTTNAVNVQFCNGLARHPLTGVLYAIVREVGSNSVRRLATINPTTGSATIIGVLSDNFANIAFRSDGVLFGVTGDGAVVPETLYTVNLNNAVTTFLMTLGNGTDGEAIAFGADGFLYHYSGFGNSNVHEICERIDTFSLTITPIVLSGFDYEEVISVTLWAGGNLFAADVYDQRIVTNTAGVVRLLGGFDHIAVKGVVFVPSPNTQPFFRPYGGGCVSTAGTIPLLVGSGIPSPGLTVQLDLLLAPQSSAAVLGIGTGTMSVPIPSPVCQVQILPIFPDLISFTTTSTGTWPASFVVPPNLPPNLFVQAAVVDGGGLIVSNPLQIHIL